MFHCAITQREICEENIHHNWSNVLLPVNIDKCHRTFDSFNGHVCLGVTGFPISVEAKIIRDSCYLTFKFKMLVILTKSHQACKIIIWYLIITKDN